jgi:hypothetical protein
LYSLFTTATAVKNDLDDKPLPCKEHCRERSCNCSLRLPALTLDSGTKSLELHVVEDDDFEEPQYLLAALRRLTPQSHLTSLTISARFNTRHCDIDLEEKPPTSLAILDSVICLGKLQSLQLFDVPIGNSDCQKIIAHLPDLR